jgi:DNA repair exonuclease SbcCD ATPase subunit
MSQTISDAILDLTRKISLGEDHKEALGGLLEQAIPATEQQLQSFLEHAPQNPEFTDEMVEQFQDGLRNLKTSFETLQSMLKQIDGAAWGAEADRLHRTMVAIRKAQQAHQDVVEDGDTSHLYLNRLLIHLRAWQGGRAPGPMTVALVQAMPHFQQDLQSFIDEFEDPAVQDRMNQHMERLMESCNDVVEAVTEGDATQEELAHWVSQIVQFSQDLDQTLAETVESHLSNGPTPFPVVNLVNAAMDRYLSQLIPAEDLADTMDQCEDWLRAQLPGDTDPSLKQAAEELFKVLQEMRETTLQGDVDQLLSQRESLFAAAENLAMFAAVLSPDDEVVNLVSTEGLSGSTTSDQRPMPQLLAQILQQAESYLSGSQNSDSLEESVQALERLVSSTEGQMSRSRDSKDVKERTQQALEILGEASHHLWDFVESASEERLRTIEELLAEASDVVNTLAPRRR